MGDAYRTGMMGSLCAQLERAEPAPPGDEGDAERGAGSGPRIGELVRCLTRAVSSSCTCACSPAADDALPARRARSRASTPKTLWPRQPAALWWF
jgi:hypothetical protein